MRPAFFFDRDGVVNVSPGEGYVLRWEDFRFSEGIIQVLQWVRARGFVLVLVTNQQGVGKGEMTDSDLNEIHARMQAELREHGADFDKIYVCTCLASDPNCTCRKPRPEMVLRAAEDCHLNLAESWLVGDDDRDIEMAAAAGVPKTIRIVGDKPVLSRATINLGTARELLACLESYCK